jgi:hypothetical protein
LLYWAWVARLFCFSVGATRKRLFLKILTPVWQKPGRRFALLTFKTGFAFIVLSVLNGQNEIANQQ